MKHIIMKQGRWFVALSTALLLSSPIVLTGCKEDISEDAYAVKSMKTMSDYITDEPELSMIKSIFDQVPLGRTANASVLTSLLSARGNFTVFAPTNDALTAYVQEYTKGTYSSLDQMPEEERMELMKLIALNCIIDNIDDKAYELAEFPEDGSTFPISNLNYRRLSCVRDEAGDYLVNGNARIMQSNIEVSNGMLHIVDHVIAPSTASVASLIKEAKNMTVMGHLLTVTGWENQLAVDTKADEDYQDEHMQRIGTTETAQPGTFKFQDTRTVAYTVFSETDDVYENDWQISLTKDAETGELQNADQVLSLIEARCQTLMNNYNATGDYTNPANAVYQFVAYHILEGGMSTDKLVHHFNEFGYDYGPDMLNPLRTGYSVNVWDYYPTMSTPSRLMKVTQVPLDGYDFYLNRVSVYDNGFKGTYEEKSFTENTPSNGLNVRLSALNEGYDNNALNGFYFPINHILIYTRETAEALGSERIRFDITSMLPELQSNDVRGRVARYFPKGYFKNIMNESQSTRIFYYKDGTTLHSGGWKDYQGDELNIIGRYDLVYKLPPVPKTGTYELRIGSSLNNLRGMVQVYLGDDPDKTSPIGLPIDQRETVGMIPGKPWVADKGDEATDRENDRNLRNAGYMKGPNYFTQDGSKGAITVRNLDGDNVASGPVLRRILVKQEFSADKTYYLRFKSAIENENSQFFFDFMEFVPSSVIDAAIPEDIW